jgi:hypothetical protein
MTILHLPLFLFMQYSPNQVPSTISGKYSRIHENSISREYAPSVNLSYISRPDTEL